MIKFEGENPKYLGDGVYASFDGYHVWLETSDGLSITNKIALEPSVIEWLNEYVKAI